MTDFQIRNKVTLLRDFLNNVGATATGVEVKVTQDTDLGLRFFVDPEVLVECKNSSGGTLTKGEAVYVSGDHASGKPEVTKARSDASGTMPSIGLVYETMADGDEGHIVAEGVLFQYDTDTPGWDAGTALYVDPATAGALTSTKPSGSTDKVQKVGLVTRRHATVGSIMVIGAGRSNDINNELVALMGVDARTQTDLGTFTGTTITDSSSVKTALQELETATELARNNELYAEWWQDYLVSDMTACGWSTKSISGGTGQAWEALTDASNCTGVNELRTNTSSTGMYAVLSYNNTLIFNNQTAYVFEARINLSAVSDDTDSFVATMGFSRALDAAYGSGGETDYAMFVYDNTTNGNVWACQTARNGTETKTTTARTITGDNETFVVLKITVASDGSSVTYAIAGTTVATHTTNIPSTGDRMGFGMRINKTGGTTNREFRIDWHRFESTRTAAR